MQVIIKVHDRENNNLKNATYHKVHSVLAFAQATDMQPTLM